VRTRPLITHRFGLDEISRAFAVHREPASIKVAVVLSQARA
jgi:threonine dehydrogenase-like Zn-dependent dehydrogenase